MAKRKKYSVEDYQRWSIYRDKFGTEKTKKHFHIGNSALYKGLKVLRAAGGVIDGTKTGRVSGKIMHASGVPKEAVINIFNDPKLPKGFERRPSLEAITLLRKAMKLIDQEHSGTVRRSMSASDAYVKLALEALEGRA